MSRIQEYRDFLMTKIKMARMAGVPCEMKDIHPILKPHQRDVVKWAVEGGQRAIFAAFGLGKTLMQRVRDMSKLLVVGQCRARGVVAKRPVLSWRQGWRESTKEQGPPAGVSDHNRTGSDLSWPE